MRISARLTVVAGVCVLAVGLAGCGDDDDDSTDDTPPNGDTTTQDTAADDQPDEADDEATLEQAVRDYTHALFAPDADTAYGLLSDRCRQDIGSADEFSAIAQDAHDQYGQLEIENITIDQIDGDLARVSYGVGVPDLERESQPWAKEDGQWRWDAC